MTNTNQEPVTIENDVKESNITQADPQRQAIAVHDDTASLMASIVRLAADPSIDLSRLDKLMDFKERVEAGEAKKAFAVDFALMKPNLPRVKESGYNNQTNSRYAFLDDINKTIDPVLGQYGFATSTKIISQTADSVTVRAELWHKSGHVEETTLTMPLDNKGPSGTVNKTLPHATKSSITYAKGAAICALLNISTGDDNDGNGDVVYITIEQAAEIDRRVRALGEEYYKRFMEWLNKHGTKTIQEINAQDHKKIVTTVATAENEAKKLSEKKVQK